MRYYVVKRLNDAHPAVFESFTRAFWVLDGFSAVKAKVGEAFEIFDEDCTQQGIIYEISAAPLTRQDGWLVKEKTQCGIYDSITDVKEDFPNEVIKVNTADYLETLNLRCYRFILNRNPYV